MFKPVDISDPVNKALKNLSDAPTATIGETLAEFLSIPKAKIHFLSEKKKIQYQLDFVEFLESTKSKISAIPTEDFIETPQDQVLGAISEDITYCMGYKELRELFASLLANSCNRKYLTIAHPSFSNTLKCMSPYDATLLKRIAEQSSSATKTIEAAEYIVLTRNSSSYELIYECIVFTDKYFSDFNMQSLSISTLKQLGIVAYTPSNPASVNKKFIENDFYRSLKKQYEDSESYPVARFTQIYLTPYGNSLATACDLFPNTPLNFSHTPLHR